MEVLYSLRVQYSVLTVQSDQHIVYNKMGGEEEGGNRVDCSPG